MGQRHLRQGEFAVGPGIDVRGEPVGATDNEYQAFEPAAHLGAEVLRECYRGILLPALVQKAHKVRALQRCKETPSFGFFLLCFRHIFSIFDVRKYF